MRRNALPLAFAWVACLLLAACSSGPVRRVSEPAVNIQQLTVRADGSWSVDLRIDNFSSVPMRFDRVVLAMTVGGESAGTLQGQPALTIGPESADVATLTLAPSPGCAYRRCRCAGARRQRRLRTRRHRRRGAGERRQSHLRCQTQQRTGTGAGPAGRAALTPIPAGRIRSHEHLPRSAVRHAFRPVRRARRRSAVRAARLHRRHARRRRRGARGRRAFHRNRAGAAEPGRRRLGLPLRSRRPAPSRTPPGFREAYAQYVDGGWAGLVAPPEFGGQGLPHVAGVPLKEMIDAANLAWGNFPLLSHGATEALLHHGERWQQEAFLRPIVEGRWTGTMCLTEAHCGTDLGLLRTQGDTERRRQLFDHRHQDLHHRRRARFHRQHRAPGARAPARCAGGQQGHLAVHRAEAARRPRRHRRRAQRGALRRASNTRWASTARRPA